MNWERCILTLFLAVGVVCLFAAVYVGANSDEATWCYARAGAALGIYAVHAKQSRDES